MSSPSEEAPKSLSSKNDVSFAAACIQLKNSVLLLPSATRTPAVLLRCPSFCSLSLMLIFKVFFCDVKPIQLRKQQKEINFIFNFFDDPTCIQGEINSFLISHIIDYLQNMTLVSG
jgi:hypothetical protein